jgi:hypothetical protein
MKDKEMRGDRHMGEGSVDNTTYEPVWVREGRVLGAWSWGGD